MIHKALPAARPALLALVCACGFAFAAAAQETPVKVKALSLTGQIEGENVTFTVETTVDALRRAARLTLVSGDLVYLDGKLPSRTWLVRQEKSYAIRFDRRGEYALSLRFAALAPKADDWRSVTFTVPEATVRQLTMVCDRDDVEVQFPDAVQVERRANAAGKTEITAYLAPGRPFVVRWKPQVRKLEGELAVTCDASTIANAGVGALRLDSVYTYRIVQGALERLVLGVPEQFNVTQVRGEDIREWRLDSTPDRGRELLVVLSRPREKTYALSVEGERVLPAFPCKFELPVMVPRGVIRASGFLMIGTDSAVKLIVGKAAGMTQVDSTSFPSAAAEAGTPRALPSRSAYAYQYAHLPFQMELTAEDVVTAFTSDEQMTVALEDNGLTLQAAVNLDVRDAPAREITILADPAWVVAQVQGEKVADYDVRDAGSNREVRIYFREAVLGRVLIQIRLERPVPEGTAAFSVPPLVIRDARAERGFLVLRAEKGIRLKEQTAEGLREVHTASVPFRVPEAQRAYRFKSPDWKLEMAIERADPAVHAELFHLVSLGEGALYGSCSTTYHIEGAPVRRFQVRIPAAYTNVEFTGRDIRGWEHTGDVWTVSLQEKVLGDYTLLLTFDQPLAEEGTRFRLGAIEPIGAASEVGYIALAGAPSLTFDAEQDRDPSMITIPAEELPREYALLINNAVLRTYKYVRAPHRVTLQVRRYSTQSLLDRVADHILLRTRISADGEAVTEATYFVKNTSQQFLSVTLPPGAQLWSALVDGEKVQALDTGKGQVLIPIKRLADPNQPSRVNLTYAETREKPRWFSRRAFGAPVSAGQSVFTRWTLTVPEDFAAVASGGNMMPPPPTRAGLLALAKEVGACFRTLWEEGRPWIWLALALLLFAAMFAYNAGRGKLVSISSLVALLLAPVACIFIAYLSDSSGFEFSADALRDFTPKVLKPSRNIEFTKPVALSACELTVGVRMVPEWLGGVGGLVRLIVGALLGLAFSVLAAASRRPTASALGLVLLTWGLTALPAAIPIIGGILAWGLPLALIVGVCRRVFASGRRRKSAPPPPSTPALEMGPPPFTAETGSASLGLIAVVAALALGGLLAASVLAADKSSAPAPVPPAGKVEKPAASSAKAKPPAEKPQPAPLQAQAETPRQALPGFASGEPVMNEVEIAIEAPDPAKEREGIARVELTVAFTLDAPGAVPLLPAAFVLTESKLDPKIMEIKTSLQGYLLDVKRRGEYRVTVRGFASVRSQAGVWTLPVSLPPHLKNRVRVTIPATGWEFASPGAAWLQTEEKKDATVGTLVLAADNAEIVWRPRERRTRLEQTVFYCDVQTYAVFAPGLANLTHLVRYQIAQGELQALRIQIPVGMTVTAVSGPGLSTWRFEPDTRLIEALLDKPVSGDFTLTVVAQAPKEGLPYEATVAAPVVQNAVRQRGSIAVAASGSVQVRAESTEGMSAINVGDFASEAIEAALKAARQPETPEIKRAFRYHQLPASLSVHAERVLPEIRVAEQASLDISDERTVLSTRLELAIARAGVFSVRLDLPEEFDIESLTGDEMSHWDEVREGGHGVLIHFQKLGIGARRVNLVLSHMEKGVGAQIRVPRVAVRDAMKHTGTLAISGERGVRLLTAERDGVSEVHPRELGIEQPGYLAFRILRPNWTVGLKTEVLAPVVRAEMLQRVDVAEGMLYGRCYLQYKIDQAGVKVFRLKAPAPGVALTVAGRHTARVHEVDRKAGIWEVELQGKVENRHALEVNYQQPFDPAAGRVRVAPLETLGVESQRGYVVAFAAGRLQVKPQLIPAGLIEDDARNVPASFGAGDLSNAILCFQTPRPDYTLDLSVIRHASADVLPARADNVRLTSVLSEDGQMVTRAELGLSVGALRFLEVTLPGKSEIWSVFVNGEAAAPMKGAGGKLLISMEPARAAGRAAVELIYAGQPSLCGFGGKHTFEGPKFNVPLTDIRWDFYAPPGYRYHGFDGTLTYRERERTDGIVVFDADRYVEETRQAMVASVKRAEEGLRKGERLWKEGKQAEAKQALKTAVAFSQGRQDLNEDARIQYRNLMRQNAVVGLYNRRSALKKSQNVYEADAAEGAQQMAAPQQWTLEQGRQVEQVLGAAESASLNKVADKLLEQQAAAQARATPIRITLPVQGVHLPFYRELQIRAGSDMSVQFKISRGRLIQWLGSLAAAVGLLMVYWAVMRFSILPGRAET